ncbi:MAG: bifunctional 5,10-methylenetetrahydrofolate dehydrogenase/5,10-methenyltetrahydrofolate cyclohydrolase [Candidatus Poribacteria bacterium]|nr:bifunctional 5,10-methylenetetrahydrofolate dehydrogenase/5,10-methenyltetrahydrofolate cyclohydrolase [Candidatus Poribacteria bacterium]
MPAEIIDGRQIAASIRKEVRQEVKSFVKKTGVTPRLVVLLVGDDPASHVYVRQKSLAAEKVGILEETRNLSDATTEAELLRIIHELNRDASVHGILVQMPLPAQISPTRVIESLDYRKDVDGFHPHNVGLAAIGSPLMEPCTPTGVLEILARTGNAPDGKHVVIVGRSNIVGKPLMNMLVQKTARANATVTVCHTGTSDIGEYTRRGDIVIAAAGRAELIKGDMLRPGSVVIDVGVNRVDDPSDERGYRLGGDVEFESAKEVARAITPVPGGVGPLTVALLMRNTLTAAQNLVG